LVASVRNAIYGAKGDGVTDDTAAIQRAVDAVAGTGGTVLIPDGTYMVNAVAHGWAGVRLGNSMVLSLSPRAVLKAIPNASGTYAILSVSYAKQVTIRGGTLQGERSSHAGSDGEWGMGLSIDHSDQVVVDGVTSRDCWGDGFYITDRCSNVTLCNVTADHNRRQGLSVTSVDGLVVRNSIFKNTRGTEPECGIDIEPNDAQVVNHVLISGCTLMNNAGSGFQCGFNSAFTTPRILNTVFDSNTVMDNGADPVSGGYRQGVKVSHAIGNVSITNNLISGTSGQGIMVMERSADTIVSGNTVTDTRMFNGNATWTGGGIYISDSPNSCVTNNTVKGNAGLGIWNCSDDPTVVIRGNSVFGNARDH
jgi:parallel beta-helix repeat protein